MKEGKLRTLIVTLTEFACNVKLE